jgi:hypothetical protein
LLTTFDISSKAAIFGPEAILVGVVAGLFLSLGPIFVARKSLNDRFENELKSGEL